jgi:glutathione S-transferase
MSTIKLYGLAASRTVRVVWMLHELGLPYEHDPISFADARLKNSPYIEINPNARIPSLVVDGFAIFESLAINQYLVEKFGGPLAPTSAEERGLLAQWSMWAMTEIDKDITTWAFNAFVKPEAERDTPAAQAALANLQRPLAVLERSLSGRDFLMGARFTASDLNVAATLYRGLAMDLSGYPKVSAWLTQCWGRDAAKAARRARGDVLPTG